mmetsp:Transcript_17440/g.27868  ORF Transcript_17440/g.27868 Transcript_17440/m.27868 type:complete len:205 (+) Transcript_17440:462-1076(+)
MWISCIFSATGSTCIAVSKFSADFCSFARLSNSVEPYLGAAAALDSVGGRPVEESMDDDGVSKGPVSTFMSLLPGDEGGRFPSIGFPDSVLESLILFRPRPSSCSFFTFAIFMGEAGDWQEEREELWSILRKKSLRHARMFLCAAMARRCSPRPAMMRQSAKTGFFSRFPTSSLKFVCLTLRFSSACLWKISIAPSPIHFLEGG